MTTLENQFEGKAEKIPTREEVLEIIKGFAEQTQFVRELSDDKGLYLLENSMQGKNEGETIQYEYIRKGRFPNHNESSVTSIEVVYYENGIPYDGNTIATFDEEDGLWKKL